MPPSEKGFREPVCAITVTATSVFETANGAQQKTSAPVEASRQERRSGLNLRVGDVFNPFTLFDGALVPSEILRCPDLTPSEKLVFARLMQFAGGKGKAWPSLERLAEEVALSLAQARRCVASLEVHGFIRRVARSGRSNEFEFLWHLAYATEPHSRMRAAPQSPVSGAGHSPMRAQGPSSMSGPGHSPVIARRESIESSSIEEIQIEENQSVGLHRRRNDLGDPEAELLLRLKERHGESVDRHAILQCVLGDLKPTPI